MVYCLPFLVNIKIYYNKQLQNYLIPTLYVPILFLCFFWHKHSVSLWADLSPGDFVHVIGDAHVYRTHVEALEEQMRKQPKPFPVSKCWLIYCIKMIYFYSKYLIFWLFNWCFCEFWIPSADFEDKSCEERYWFFCNIRLQTGSLWSSPEDRNEDGSMSW